MLKTLSFLLLPLCAVILLAELTLEFIHAISDQPSSMASYSFAIWTRTGKRISSFDGDLKLLTDPALLHVNMPNQKDPRFAINSLGFRGQEISPPNGRTRILLLGGSTVFGTGLPGDGDTISSHMERLNPALQVINGGVMGHGSLQELLSYVLNRSTLNPDIAISFSGWNDWNYGVMEYHPEVLGDLLSLYENQLLLGAPVNSLSLLDRGNLALSSVLLPSLVRGMRFFHPPSQLGFGLAEIQAAESFSNNQRQLEQLVTTHGKQHILLIQPDRRSATKDGLTSFPVEGQSYEKFRQHVKTLLSDRTNVIYDTNADPRMSDAQLYMDPVHLTANGCRKAAEILVEAVAQLPN